MSQETIAQALGAEFQRARELDAPVNQRLALYSGAVRRHFAAYAEAFDNLVTRLSQNGAGVTAPNVGDRMPPFLLPDDQGGLTSLDDLCERGPVAITFLRGHWCPYCRIYAHMLAQAQERASSIGAQIVAISPELERYTRQQKAEAQAGFKVLSDINNGYALSLNLAIWIGDEMQKLLTDYGRDLADYQGTGSWFVPIPATYIVSPDATIKARFVDPDYSRRMDIEELLAALANAR